MPTTASLLSEQMVILHRVKSGSGLTASTHNIIQQRLAQLSAHLVIAIIILVVIGGATRVMEAGLACPDWPLCYGSLLPREQISRYMVIFSRAAATFAILFICLNPQYTVSDRHFRPRVQRSVRH